MIWHSSEPAVKILAEVADKRSTGGVATLKSPTSKGQ